MHESAGLCRPGDMRVCLCVSVREVKQVTGHGRQRIRRASDHPSNGSRCGVALPAGRFT